ncbi:ribosome maturation factor RimM [Thermodesulfobacteriota bacterium]
MTHVSSEDLLLLGRVVRPHGMTGLLRIWSYARSGESFQKDETVFIRKSSGEIHQYKLSSFKPYKKFFLMKIEGLDSLEDAESFRGADILARKAPLWDENDGAFFWQDLIGLAVYTDTGQFLGNIEHILPTGSNDIYVVRTENKEILIPAIHDVVIEVDLEKKKMTVAEMEGLLDLNEV